MDLFDQIDFPVRRVLDRIMADKRARSALVYKRFKSASFDETVGYRVVLYDDFDFYGIRLRHNKKSILIASGNVEIGDEVYIVRGSDVPTEMSLKDRMEDADGNLYTLTSIDNIFDLAVMISVAGSHSIPS